MYGPQPGPYVPPPGYLVAPYPAGAMPVMPFYQPPPPVDDISHMKRMLYIVSSVVPGVGIVVGFWLNDSSNPYREQVGKVCMLVGFVSTVVWGVVLSAVCMAGIGGLVLALPGLPAIRRSLIRRRTAPRPAQRRALGDEA